MKYSTWTEQEIAYIVEHRKDKSDEEIADALGRTKASVSCKICRLLKDGAIGYRPRERGKKIKKLHVCRGAKTVSDTLAKMKEYLLANREINMARAARLDIEDGLARMGSFVSRHIKFRDPND